MASNQRYGRPPQPPRHSSTKADQPHHIFVPVFACQPEASSLSDSTRAGRDASPNYMPFKRAKLSAFSPIQDHRSVMDQDRSRPVAVLRAVPARHVQGSSEPLPKRHGLQTYSVHGVHPPHATAGTQRVGSPTGNPNRRRSGSEKAMLELMEAVRAEHSTNASKHAELGHVGSSMTALATPSRDHSPSVILPNQWPDDGPDVKGESGQGHITWDLGSPLGSRGARVLSPQDRRVKPLVSRPVSSGQSGMSLAAVLHERGVAPGAPAAPPGTPTSASAYRDTLQRDEAAPQHDQQAAEHRQLALQRAAIERTVRALERRLVQERRAWDADARDVNEKVQHVRKEICDLHNMLQESDCVNRKLEQMVADERRRKERALAVASARARHLPR